MSTEMSEVPDESVKQDRIEELRKLVTGKVTLQKLRTDDLYMLRFLYCTDFDVEKALVWMEEYSSLLLSHPDWFARGSPKKFRHVVESNAKVMIKMRDRKGRRIFINKSSNIASSNTTVQEQAILDELWIEAVLDEPETMAAGISYIVDMKGFTFKMFRWITPSNLRIGKRKEALYPCRDLVYHVVNSNSFMNASMKLVWPFLTDKVKEKIIFHYSDWDSLHKHISPEVLPPEYGGTGPEIDYEAEKKWLYERDNELEKTLMFNRLMETGYE